MGIYEFDGISPQIANDVFIAPTASIIGDVIIEEGCSIWFGAVLRGDEGPIRIGKNTNIQDNCIVHMTSAGTYIGENNTIGHGSILHECTIGNFNVIGMNSVLLDGSIINNECVIAAGSVVTGNSKFPSRQLIAGIPAKIKKEVSGKNLWWTQESSNEYLKLIKKYNSTFEKVN